MKYIYTLVITLLFFSCGNTISDTEKFIKITSEFQNTNFETEIESNNQTEDDFDCPPEGNAKPKSVRKLNTFKNRKDFPDQTEFNESITLTEILKPGNDKNRWSNNDAAKIIGYVYDIKSGGIETTNCKSKDKAMRDTHIEIVLNPMNATKKDVMVVEVTPRLRSIMKSRGEDWTTSMLKSKFLGRWVEIEGWMLFDDEHDNMAENTNPGNPKNWRATAWEIHPITSIKVTQRPR
ncbi:MAG: hypothetical protein ACK452_01515 [Bacteroidota bacterium]|jgi:hypothetical protein